MPQFTQNYRKKKQVSGEAEDYVKGINWLPMT